MIKDLRFWTGGIGTLIGLRLYSLAHEIAARNWVQSVIEAQGRPGGPPANVSHGWGMPTQGTEGYFWGGLVLMLLGIIMMIWSAKRVDNP